MHFSLFLCGLPVLKTLYFIPIRTFFLLTFLTRYLDAIKTTLPSISTFSFPCCSVILLLQKTVSRLNPTQSFLGLYPVPWKLPGNWSFPPNLIQLTGHHSHQTLDYYVYFTEEYIIHFVFGLFIHVSLSLDMLRAENRS